MDGTWLVGHLLNYSFMAIDSNYESYHYLGYGIDLIGCYSGCLSGTPCAVLVLFCKCFRARKYPHRVTIAGGSMRLNVHSMFSILTQ
jgi:hypothetical protein